MRNKGFSLLEILVAFSILAIALGVLMQIFASAARNADLAREQARATTLAQSLLASASVEAVLVAGETSGSTPDMFRWQVEVAPFDTADGPTDNVPAAMPSPLDLWRVTARVAWDGAGSIPERSVTLATLRTRPRALQ
jgi:general secretion pathway protein I